MSGCGLQAFCPRVEVLIGSFHSLLNTNANGCCVCGYCRIICCMVLRGDGLSTFNVLCLKIHEIRETLLSPFYRWGRNMQKDSVTQSLNSSGSWILHECCNSRASHSLAEFNVTGCYWYLIPKQHSPCKVPKSLHKNDWIAFFPICRWKMEKKSLWRLLTHCNEFLSQEKDQVCEMLWDSWVGHLPNFKAWLNTVALCS